MLHQIKAQQFYISLKAFLIFQVELQRIMIISVF